MLTPEQLGSYPEYLVTLVEQYDSFVVADFSRRVSQAGRITDTAEWQARRVEELGLAMDELKRQSEELTGISQEEMSRLFDEAGLTYIESERTRLGAGAGLNVMRVLESEALAMYIASAYEQTAGLFRNLTGTTATGLIIGGQYMPMQDAYLHALDLAQMQVSTGVLDYETAVRHAIRDISRMGISTLMNNAINYDSGARLSVRAAARMCVITGMNQMARHMNDYIADELGLDLVEVTAHAGARPTHAVWQGEIYSRSGKSREYPDLVDATGLGEVTGLCGANCRHNYYGYMEGSPRAYPPEYMKQLREEDAKRYEFDGKSYNAYEASQKQRAMERQMIATKRELIGYDAAGDTEAYQAAAIRLRRQRERYRDFSYATGGRPDYARAQQDGYDRRLAGRSTWAVSNYNKKRSAILKAGRTSTGIPINEVAAHVVYRSEERGKGVNDIISALTSPLKVDKIKANRSQKFIGETATVAINVDTGKVITVWPTNHKVLRKIRREKGE